MTPYTFLNFVSIVVIVVGAAVLMGGGSFPQWQLAQVAQVASSELNQSAAAPAAEEMDQPNVDGGLNQEEVENVLKYIGENLRDYGVLLKRLNKAKLPGIEPYRVIVSEMLGQIKETRNMLTSAASHEDKRDSLDNYNRIEWPEIEEAGVAADIAEQLPKTMKLIPSLSKLVNQFNKSPQLASLIGLDIAQLTKTIGDSSDSVRQLNSLVASGNLPEAIDTVRQEGERIPWHLVETLYYQVTDLLSAAQRLNKLKKFPEIAEQIRQLLAPAWADFYSDPGGVGSLHGGETDESVTANMWKILDAAEERARKRR